MTLFDEFEYEMRKNKKTTDDISYVVSSLGYDIPFKRFAEAAKDIAKSFHGYGLSVVFSDGSWLEWTEELRWDYRKTPEKGHIIVEYIRKWEALL